MRAITIISVLLFLLAASLAAVSCSSQVVAEQQTETPQTTSVPSIDPSGFLEAIIEVGQSIEILAPDGSVALTLYTVNETPQATIFVSYIDWARSPLEKGENICREFRQYVRPVSSVQFGIPRIVLHQSKRDRALWSMYKPVGELQSWNSSTLKIWYKVAAFKWKVRGDCVVPTLAIWTKAEVLE